MQGLPKEALPRQTATLANDIPANGPRQHYMRAQHDTGALTVETRQDSALLSVLATANALAIRPPHDPARAAGTEISFISL